jgi:thioredoxin-like negative regulator of GroEL
LAGSAFKDAETLKVLGKFTPILVDKDTEPEVAREFGVGGIPHVIFVDLKGKKIADSLGAVPVAKFRATAEEASKKAGKPKPSKDYKKVLKALADIENGLTKKKPKSVLSGAAVIEKVGKPASAVERARKAREKVTAQGKESLAAAKAKQAAGDLEGAKKLLRKLSADFKGTDVGKEASAVLKEVTAALKNAAK